MDILQQESLKLNLQHHGVSETLPGETLYQESIANCDPKTKTKIENITQLTLQKRGKI